QQVSNAKLAAITEAERVAQLVADMAAFDPPGPAQALWKDPRALQQYVNSVYKQQDRDLVIMDANRVTLADAVPSEVGGRFADPGGVGSRTLADGKARTFIEAVGAERIRQLITPVRWTDGRIVGAVVLEYSPLYDEMLKPTGETMKLLIAGS